MGITCESLFGDDASDLVDQVLEQFPISTAVLEKRMRSPLRLPRWVPLRAHRRERAANETMERVIGTLIARRQKGGPSTDLLGRILRAGATEDGYRMTEAEVRSNIAVFLIAGYETTANSLAWTFYLLSKHPEAQEAAAEEAVRVLGDRQPAVEDLDRLPLLQRIYHESLRLFPPGQALTREAISADKLPSSGVEMDPKNNFVVPTYALHRDPALWPEPDRFDPERFTAENEAKRHPFAFVPFARAARECIGKGFAVQESLLILAMTLRRFRLVLNPANFEPKVRTAIVLSPEKIPVLASPHATTSAAYSAQRSG
jgi:cytochrome P450